MLEFYFELIGSEMVVDFNFAARPLPFQFNPKLFEESKLTGLQAGPIVWDQS